MINYIADMSRVVYAHLNIYSAVSGRSPSIRDRFQTISVRISALPGNTPVTSGGASSLVKKWIIIPVIILAAGLLLLFSPDELHAQRTVTTEAGASLRIYSTEDGIPSNTPTNAFVDNKGYLWLSTSGGTVRITGNEIEDFGAEHDISMMRLVKLDRERDILWFTDSETLIRFDGERISRFTARDGYIPPGGARKEVQSIHTDTEGRVWIGSFTPPFDTPHNGGLMLLDESRFHTFSADEFSLHNVLSIFEASDGSLWFNSIGYNGNGYFSDQAWSARYRGGDFEVFDGENDCINVQVIFREPKGVTAAIVEDNTGTLWFNCTGKTGMGDMQRSNNGLYRFDGDTFQAVDEINSRLVDGYNISEMFYNDITDELFVSLGKSGGLSSAETAASVYKFRDGEWRQEKIASEETLIEKTSRVLDAEAVIFIGYYLLKDDEGQTFASLRFVDRFTNSFQSLLFVYGENGWEWIDTLPGFILMNLPGNVYFTAHDGSDLVGIYTPPVSRLITHNNDLLKAPGTGSRMFMDRDHHVWIHYGSQWNNEKNEWDDPGVSLWDGQQIRHFTTENGLSSNHLYFPAQSADGSIWFPSDKGVNRLQKQGQRYAITPFYGPGGVPMYTRSVAEAPDGRIFAYVDYVAPATQNRPENRPWFGLFNGSYFEPFESPFPDSLTALEYHSYELNVDRSNRVWVLARFASDDSGSLFSSPTHIRILENGTWKDPKEAWGVPDTRLFYVGELENGRYYIVDGGFFKFDFDKQRFVDLSDSVNAHADFRILKRVNTSNMRFEIQGDNHLYIRFRDMGIAIFDGQNLTYLDRRSGLTSLNLLYPNEAPDGDVLFTAPGGGAIFSGKEFMIMRDEALRDGSPLAIARDARDNMLILYQGIGLTVTERDTTRYPVRIASIRVDTLQFFEGQSVRLKSSQNNIEFRFATLNFTNPDNTRFSFILEGYNADWSQPSFQNYTDFRDLPFGRYTFRLRSISPGNIISDEAVFAFVIAPPWWRTWWAYLFYLVIFVMLVIATDRVQRQRLIRRAREKARERELAYAREIQQAYHDLEKAHEDLKSAQEQLVQQEKLASLGQLTAGIAHEIKNPLNFVNNFSEISLDHTIRHPQG